MPWRAVVVLLPFLLPPVLSLVLIRFWPSLISVFGALILGALTLLGALAMFWLQHKYVPLIPR